MKDDTILTRMIKGGQEGKSFYTEGSHMSGAVYISDETHWDMIAEVMRLNITSNPLHMNEFSFVTQLETEVIRMTLDLYNGSKDTCGITTSGGTESIVMAMLAYREWGLKTKGITKPNIVMSHTAHAAFDKACFYFNIEMRKVH